MEKMHFSNKLWKKTADVKVTVSIVTSLSRSLGLKTPVRVESSIAIISRNCFLVLVQLRALRMAIARKHLIRTMTV